MGEDGDTDLSENSLFVEVIKRLGCRSHRRLLYPLDFVALGPRARAGDIVLLIDAHLAPNENIHLFYWRQE